MNTRIKYSENNVLKYIVNVTTQKVNYVAVGIFLQKEGLRKCHFILNTNHKKKEMLGNKIHFFRTADTH